MSNSKKPATATSNEQAPLLVDGGANDNHHASSTGPTDTPHQLSTSNLAKFRNAIGINVSSQSSNPQELEAARLKPSGLYKEIIHLQRSRNLQYYIFEYFYYGALISQILIGSILAALGSLGGLHPQIITLLGVLNTSIAGILALMKGQGLPDRVRKDAYEMKKVQDFIEETDIKLAIEDDIQPGELVAIVEKVFDMYNTARDTAEMNHPSNYAHQAEGPENGDGQRPQVGGQGNGQRISHDGTEDDGVGIRSVNRVATSGSQKLIIS